MAMKAVVLALLAIAVAKSDPARSQSLTTEADVTAGYSSDQVGAVATQVRAFGELKAGVRFYVEGAWATRSGSDTDAFGAAYPYDKRVQAVEAFGERTFRPGAGLVGVRAGRYRTPFGISGRGDYAYSGFLRAPLIRYDDYFALSNSFLEQGVDVILGAPQLQVEASLGAPSDIGATPRRSGLDEVFRVQGYRGAWIIGVSHIRTHPDQPETFAHGLAVFTGIDLRWTLDGVLARGEWITGQPFDGATTNGWYADVTVHRPAMGPLTAVFRAEGLNYEAVAPFSRLARRQTIGVRVRLPRGLTAQANVLHQTGDLVQQRPTALDAGLTYSIRFR
jgi:hypothetical protein